VLPLLLATATLASFAFALHKPKAKVAQRAKGSKQLGSREHGAGSMEQGAWSREQGAGWAIYSQPRTQHPAPSTQHPAPSTQPPAASSSRRQKAKGEATFAFGYLCFWLQLG
jgi:hypothetical protein